jgi:hypothetical protein
MATLLMFVGGGRLYKEAMMNRTIHRSVKQRERVIAYPRSRCERLE